MEKHECEHLRREIKKVADDLYERMATNDGEARANAVLAYRHLEDASMRIGKVIQALDGGESVYDRDQVVGA
jgi:hypothetical protein